MIEAERVEIELSALAALQRQCGILDGAADPADDPG